MVVVVVAVVLERWRGMGFKGGGSGCLKFDEGADWEGGS